MFWGFAQHTGRLRVHTCRTFTKWCYQSQKGAALRCMSHGRNHSSRSCRDSPRAVAAVPSQEAARQESGQLEGPVPQLVLYNSLTRKKETFKPRLTDGTVTMYVCGVTVYDYSHIGHARVYVSFDILYRYLQLIGYKVHYVRNFTDIDDKIINRAQESGESPERLSSRFIAEYHRDMAALNCLPPTQEPKATEHLQEIITDIKRIIAHGSGYQSGGDVFFDVSTVAGYGRLSGRKQEDNRAGERVAVDGRKRNAADFVLWKAAKEGEPRWDSPWGPGRPGWHIECSAMIRHNMGAAIDIHGGGRDLLFPHHENEIAQAQAAASECDCEEMHAGRGFVNYWVHNGFVNVDSEKMSKSLGNFFTIRDVIRQYHPLALRFFLVSSQYRAAINYTQKNLEMAADRVYYIYQTLYDCQQALEGQPEPSPSDRQEEGSPAHTMLEELHGGLADDLNTSPVISALSEPLKRVNDFCHTRKGKKAKGRIEELRSLQAGFKAVLSVLGLWSDEPAAVLLEMRDVSLVRAGVTEEDVSAAIKKRAEARKAKDFAAADAVRDEMAQRGIQIMDTPQGTTWRPAANLEGLEP